MRVLMKNDNMLYHLVKEILCFSNYRSRKIHARISEISYSFVASIILC